MTPTRSAVMTACLALLLAGTMAAPAYANDPDIPERGMRDIDFVPAGWSLYDKAEGDLNGDGRSDSVLVIQGNDPALVIDNPDGLGVDRYDANPRILLFVVSDEAGGLRLAGRDDAVIPARDSPAIDDPYNDLDIVDGKVTLRLHFWASAGSWLTFSRKFHFRWDGAAFAVIGYDQMEVHRASGVSEQLSANYLTMRGKRVIGNIEDDAGTEAWITIAPENKTSVGTIGNGFEFVPF